MKINFKKCLLAVAIIAAGTGFYSCADKVDDSDLYTFTGSTITDYLQKSDNYNYFNIICEKVRLSKKSDSNIAQLLSARGNYTVFVPTNEAIQSYLDSIYVTKDYDITQIPDSTAEYIVRNSIIDNGIAHAYLSTDFLVGALEKTNMNDRYITISYGQDTVSGKATTIVNEHSIIIAPDVELTNGVIHGVDNVVSMSNAYLPDLIEQTPNLKVFSMLLKQTGWDKKMSFYRDEDYEQNHPETITSSDFGTLECPKHRYYGFTAFVETDSIFMEKWGIPAPILANGILQNGDEILEVIKEKAAQAYPAATGTDLKEEDNAVNQFVSYHLLPERLTLDKIVVHHAEMGYAYNNPSQLSIDVAEYYETLPQINFGSTCKSHRRMMKITEGKQTNGKRINRHCKYKTDVEAGDFYEEYDVDREGILIEESNKGYVNNALNGFYYTIDDILLYDPDVPNTVLNERLRWDISALLPEFITNGYRLTTDTRWHIFPPGYFDYMQFSKECKYRYQSYYYSSLPNYQGDEHNLNGQYDVIFRLPPVPYYGTWELRITKASYPTFGMAQMYIGKNPDNLHPIGLPVDLRLEPRNVSIGNEIDTDDWDHNYENDKAIRLHGYMKPPYHNGLPAGGGVVSNSLRNCKNVYEQNLRMRRIVTQGTFGPDEVWYLRVKSVLESTATMFLWDYMEWAPKWVYSGTEPEDIW
ncbi:MAG: fasciclin domain-containing protein [Bacteroidaceae bacterium]|nr:fasciclin domain-containing protein [Bacteroidaceae bacterium]MBR4783197.1 fasciclin domain-containing protein [Bacteroidaceae bacterium]